MTETAMTSPGGLEPEPDADKSRPIERFGAQVRFLLQSGYAVIRGGGYRPRSYDDEILAEMTGAPDDESWVWAEGQSLAGIRSFLPAPVAAADRAWAPSAADEIYAAFDASQPVDEPQDLRGRDEQIAQLMRGVLYRRTHGVVSGPRGSGKTSLVRVFAQYAESEGVIVFYVACNRGSTFAELMHDFLEQIPTYAVDPDKIELFTERVAQFGRDGTPHQAASIFSLIRYSQIVLVVDEFERVENTEFYWKVASLLKLISDSRVPVRLVAVGGTSIFDQVISEHPSLMRNLTRLTTEPLSPAAVDEVLDACADRCEMRFTAEAKKLLCEVICGSPYHARLFGMHSALAAAANRESAIARSDVLEGLSRAFDEWASLNPEDAAAFLAIMSGVKGDPRQYMAAARRLATPQEQKSAAATLRKLYDANEQRVLKALAPAVEWSDSGIVFRDSTAAQFLIALQYISTGPKRSRRTEGGSRV
jgi:hypothetical protein